MPGTAPAGSGGTESDPLDSTLGTILPPGALRTSELYRAVYARDASYYEYWPRAVARVSTVDEVQRVLALAAQHGVPVTFRAAGTSLCGQTLGTGIVADLRSSWKGLEVLDQIKTEAKCTPENPPNKCTW